MHRRFRKLLEDATGESEFVIAINLDIREFTQFSQRVESPDVTMFIKRVYMKLIDEYFVDACFFKPAGDGLLILIPYTEHSLKEVARNAVNICFKAIKNFPTFCKNDAMINFDVPKKIGIGISRGTVCGLKSKEERLDYSGTTINLASRLMDMARPSGIVIDSRFDLNLLLKNARDQFKKQKVFVKGIAEAEPIEILITKEFTKIEPIHKRPLQKVEWETQKYNRKLSDFKAFSWFKYYLNYVPLDLDQVSIEVDYPKIHKGRVKKDAVGSLNFKDFEFRSEAGKPQLWLNYQKLVEILEANNVKERMDVFITINYPKQ